MAVKSSSNIKCVRLMDSGEYYKRITPGGYLTNVWV